MIAFFGSIMIALAALLIPNRTPYSRIWRPSFLMAVMSAVGWSVTWLYFELAGLDPVVEVLYLVGLFSFLAADWATTSISGDIPRVAAPQRFEVGQLVPRVELAWIFALLAGIGTVLLAYLYQQRSTMFNMFEFGAALRYAEAIAQLPTYGAYHFLLFGQVLAAVLVLNPRLVLRFAGYGLFAIMVFASFVAVSRTTLFFNMAALAFLMYARTKNYRALALPVATAVALMFYYAVIAGKDEVGQESFFWHYAGYAVVAFSQFILPMIDWDWGINSFGAPALLIAGRQPEDLSEMGTQYNVYSFIGSPYRDFGLAGVILLPFLFGILWSLVWNRVATRPFYLIMYAYMLLPCVIPMFDWKFNFTSYFYLAPLLLLLLRGRFVDEAESIAAQPQPAGQPA